MFRFLSLVLLLGTSLLIPANAQLEFGSGFGSEGKDPKSVATMIAEDTVISPGKPFTVAVKIDLPTDWHSYFVNSGGLEQPLKIQWALPEGYIAGPIQWPTPEVTEGYEAKSYVYSGSPVFLTEITPSPTAQVGDTVELSAHATWQICRTGACLDEKAEFKLHLPLAEAPIPNTEHASLFQQARAAIPKESSEWSATFQKAGDHLKLRLKPGIGAAPLDSATLEFIPLMKFAKNFTDGGSVDREGSDWIITLRVKKEDILGNTIPIGDQLDGILSMGSPLDLNSKAQAIVIRAAANEGSTGSVATPSMPLPAFLRTMGLMLLGGLILNLMPCVFPVIGLKIMGFVQQAGEDSRKVVAHGLSFTGGVLLSFWILSGILFAVRAAALAKTGSAETIGWGYQLQNPWFVLSIVVLLFLLGLNMFGVFEIGTSATSIGGTLQSKKGLMGSFFSGFLATLVATPCSAPLLGPAIGAAINLPAFQFFAAFSAMAIGLSLPYLVLSIFPGLIAYLPRPGAWMESFKQGMSFLLFATAGYFLTVYVSQVSDMLRPIFGLTSIALAAWIYGRWNLPHRTTRARWTATILAMVFGIGGFWFSGPKTKSELVWETWSAERVEELNQNGVPVFVDFTATWCATCLVNKSRAYSPEVIALMKEKGVIALKADKTNPNPAIEAKLQELGRTAIPVNVLYVPGKEPLITPEILSADYMENLLQTQLPGR